MAKRQLWAETVQISQGKSGKTQSGFTEGFHSPLSKSLSLAIYLYSVQISCLFFQYSFTLSNRWILSVILPISRG